MQGSTAIVGQSDHRRPLGRLQRRHGEKGRGQEQGQGEGSIQVSCRICSLALYTSDNPSGFLQALHLHLNCSNCTENQLCNLIGRARLICNPFLLYASDRLLPGARHHRTTAAPGRPSPPGTTAEGDTLRARGRHTDATAARRRPGRTRGRRPRRDPGRRPGPREARRARPRGTSRAVRTGRKGRATRVAAPTPGPARRRRLRRCARGGVPLQTRGTPTRRGRASSTTRLQLRRLRPRRPRSRRGTTSGSTTRWTRVTRTTSPSGSRRGSASGRGIAGEARPAAAGKGGGRGVGTAADGTEASASARTGTTTRATATATATATAVASAAEAGAAGGAEGVSGATWTSETARAGPAATGTTGGTVRPAHHRRGSQLTSWNYSN